MMRWRNSNLLFSLAVLFFFCTYGADADVWAKWADRAHELCLQKLGQYQKASITGCENLQEVIEEALHSVSLKLASVLPNPSQDHNEFRDVMVERSNKAPWKAQGERILTETIDHVLKNDIKEQQQMNKYFQPKFSGWFISMAEDKPLAEKKVTFVPAEGRPSFENLPLSQQKQIEEMKKIALQD